jgi:asparagine synthase (glutamine-hydrolysing)
MCGIAGDVNLEAPPDRDAVERMCAQLVHRGPDSEGFHFDDQAALGVRRLAIIDVEGGDQPLYNEDGTVVAVCNGEIYNFEELRERLMAAGHRFATRSDAEVLVHLYEDRGDDLVSDLRGMFAFALWDRRRRRLLLARDRVGKKPLFFWSRDNRLSFASELAALLALPEIDRRPDPRAIDAYLTLLYVPHPLSAIEGVQKLPPASTLTWENGRTRTRRYWRLDYAPKEPGSRDEVTDRIREHLREAVRLRLVSERPLGVFLSGGVDSTAVVATMAEIASGPIKTFSIGFTSDRFDELPYARRVADLFATQHTEHVVEPNAVAVLPQLVRHYGEPFADPSAVPSFYVAQLARQEVVVALNGDGGDESFAGYNRYVASALARRLDVLPTPLRLAAGALARLIPDGRPPASTFGRARRFAIALSETDGRRYLSQMAFLSHGLRERLYQPEFLASVLDGYATQAFGEYWDSSSAPHAVDRALDVDVQTYLPGDLLTKMDIATMASSLEARSPFLDHVFMEMAARLPVTHKVSGRQGKVALKDAFRPIVPADLLDRPKQGFSVPLADWLRGGLRAATSDLLLDPRGATRDYVRPDVVDTLVKEHMAERSDWSSQLWALLVLELWHRWLKGGDSAIELA